MITFKPCTVDDIARIEAQRAQRGEVELVVSDELVRASIALAAYKDTTCLAAAGYRLVWGGRAVAWALLSEAVGPVMLPVARRMRLALDACPARRVEMTVRADFAAACRLAGFLGFRCETPGGMGGFFPDGGAGYLFARVQE